MGEFAVWLHGEGGTPDVAFTAHRRLVEIHPFNDGNGRTARLLMNLILIRGGYPPVVVRPRDRPDSDTDIMIEIDPAARIGVYEYVGLKEYIASLFDGAVDVVHLGGLKTYVKPTVTVDAIYAF